MFCRVIETVPPSVMARVLVDSFGASLRLVKLMMAVLAVETCPSLTVKARVGTVSLPSWTKVTLPVLMSPWVKVVLGCPFT